MVAKDKLYVVVVVVGRLREVVATRGSILLPSSQLFLKLIMQSSSHKKVNGLGRLHERPEEHLRRRLPLMWL